jgi:DNA-binding SARP family transcriptional activator/tetratricopeptide (TPR) repeat protein
VEFRLLGPFEAWHDGAPVELGDLQQRYILVVLLLHLGRPVATDRLIATVWGENRPKTNLVPGYIAKIRKLLRDATEVSLDTTPTGYVLRMPEDRLDTVRFTKLCEEADQARRDRDRDRATALLRTAVALRRGPFLEDLDIDRVGGSEVISPDEAYFDALGDLAEGELAVGNHRWVRDQLWPAVHAEPSRQRLALLLMRALLANGDRVKAMEVYHRTREALDEYGMETSTELRRLVWLAQHGEPLSTLPPRPAAFTGRAEELQVIESHLRESGPGLVWLSGLPGVGKTALAVEAAHRLRSRFTDGRLFIELNGFTPNAEPLPAAEALAHLLADLGVPAERIPAGAAARAELYQDRLAGTRTLVVLDNVRSAEQVRPLLPEDPGCLAIATSRVTGDLDAGINLRLRPLPADNAAELFRRLVGATRVQGRSAQVDDVVTRCGRLPLMIRVVAAQFRRHEQWPLDHLIRMLMRAGPWRRDAGFGDTGAVPYLVSYQQLDGPQRTLFRLLGHLPGHDLNGYGAAALMACDLARARDLLDGLHAISLLEESTPEQYHLLDPLKEFATTLAGPDAPHQPPEALGRLLDFYLVTTSAAAATAFPFDREQQPAVERKCLVMPMFPDQKAALAWLGAERPNLVAAITYAAEHDFPEHAWRLAVLLSRFFGTSGHLKDWTETLELAKRTVLANPGNRYGQAHVLLRLSTAHWRSGRLTEALEVAAQALTRWVALGDVQGEADTLCAIALPMVGLGDHERAIAHFGAALDRYEKTGDRSGQAHALSQLGALNEQQGDLELAERQQVTAVELLRTIGYPRGLAHTLDNLGSVRQRLGRLDQAMANHAEAHALAVDIGDRSLQAYTLNYIGNAHRRAGRLDEAVQYQAQAAAAVANTIIDANLHTRLHLDRGATSQARGEHPAALGAFQKALDLATGTGDRRTQAQSHHGIAQALHAVGEHDRATGHWHTAEAEFDQLRTPEANEIRQERQQLPCACAGG